MAKKNVPVIAVLVPLALGAGALVYGIATFALAQGYAAHRLTAALARGTSTQTAALVTVILGALLLAGSVVLAAMSRVLLPVGRLAASIVAPAGFGLLGYGVASYGVLRWSLVNQISRAAGQQSSGDRLAILCMVLGALLGSGGLVAALRIGIPSRGSGRRRR